MDVATFVGIAGGFVVAVMGIGETVCVCNWPSLIVVFFGGLAATTVAFPVVHLDEMFRVMWKAFFNKQTPPGKLIDQIVGMSETARREGILALEEKVKEVDDPFLAGGVRLAVDGTEPALIMDILETELRFIEERHRRGQRLMRTLGWNWALFGVIGVVLLLISRADDVSTGIELVSQAVYPLFHAGLLAGLIGWPFARKLAEYSQQEALVKRMIIEGVMAIQSGDNPRIVEHKLSVFVAPRLRPSGEEKPKAAPAPAPVADEGLEEKVAAFADEKRELVLRMVRETVQEHEGDEEQKTAVEEMVGKVERGEMELAALLAALDGSVLRSVMQKVKNPPPPLLAQTRALEAKFAFGDFVELTDGQIQMLLRQIDQKDMVIALKGASPEVREKFLGNMSERVRTFITEEIGLTRASAEEVFLTQVRIVAVVYRHAERGEIELPAG